MCVWVRAGRPDSFRTLSSATGSKHHRHRVTLQPLQLNYTTQPRWGCPCIGSRAERSRCKQHVNTRDRAGSIRVHTLDSIFRHTHDTCNTAGIFTPAIQWREARTAVYTYTYTYTRPGSGACGVTITRRQTTRAFQGAATPNNIPMWS